MPKVLERIELELRCPVHPFYRGGFPGQKPTVRVKRCAGCLEVWSAHNRIRVAEFENWNEQVRKLDEWLATRQIGFAGPAKELNL